MALDEDKMVGAFGAKPSTTIQMRGPGRYAQATAGMTPRTNFRDQAMEASRAAAEKARQRQSDLEFVQQKMPDFAAANPEGARQYAMGLAAALRSRQANPATPAVGSAALQAGDNDAGYVAPNDMPADTVTSPVSVQDYGQMPARQREDGVFVNDVPQKGFGSVIYSDSYRGAMGKDFGKGNMVSAGFGPFGRSPEEQAAIEKRVGDIQRATDFIRGMRDVPSELDQFKAQAQQNISLNQGLGAFLNQASQRNYARQRVQDLETQGKDMAQMALDAQQQGFENALATRKENREAQEAMKGNFKTTSIVGPDGQEIPMITNTDTGEVSFGRAPERQMTELEARDVFTRMADQEWSDKGGTFTDEQDVFKVNGKGVSREDWIEAQVKKATQKSEAPKIKYSQFDLEETAKKYGMTTEQVEKILSGAK